MGRYEKSQIQCYNYNKYSLYTYECRSITNNLEGKTNYVETKDQEEPTGLLAYKGKSEKINTCILTLE